MYGGVEAIRHQADPGADRLLGKALGLNTEKSKTYNSDRLNNFIFASKYSVYLYVMHLYILSIVEDV